MDAGYLRPGHPGLLWHPVRRGVQGVYRVSHQGHLPVIGIDVFAASGIQTVLLLFGIGGMIAGSVSAIFARRLTTMIAFSSAAQIGYI